MTKGVVVRLEGEGGGGFLSLLPPHPFRFLQPQMFCKTKMTTKH